MLLYKTVYILNSSPASPHSAKNTEPVELGKNTCVVVEIDTSDIFIVGAVAIFYYICEIIAVIMYRGYPVIGFFDGYEALRLANAANLSVKKKTTVFI